MWSGHFLSYLTLNHPAEYPHSSVAVLGPGCTLLALLFAALVVKCTRQGLLQRIFLWRPLRRVGKYSFGMYMLHWPIMRFVSKQVLSKVGHLHAANPVIYFLMLTAAAYAAAYISFEVFEKHFLKLKRHFPAAGNQSARPVRKLTDAAPLPRVA